MKYHLVPVTGREARKWIEETHRHLPKLQGALFAVGVADEGERLVGVGTAGNPPRVWQGTGRFVITRVAVLPNLLGHGAVQTEGDYRLGKPLHSAPCCTMLYGALCRAGKALAYSEAWTYTLPDEPGTSLLAAGFTSQGWTDGGEWDRPSRPRGPAARPEAKQRWMRALR